MQQILYVTKFLLMSIKDQVDYNFLYDFFSASVIRITTIYLLVQ